MLPKLPESLAQDGFFQIVSGIGSSESDNNSELCALQQYLQQLLHLSTERPNEIGDAINITICSNQL
jgi:hypothetical protein